MENVEEVLQVMKNTFTVCVSSVAMKGIVICLVKEQDPRVRMNSMFISPKVKYMYLSDREPAVPHCPDIELIGVNPCWLNSNWNVFPVVPFQKSSDGFNNFTVQTGQQKTGALMDPEGNQNYSLVFSSLSNSNTGLYTCVNNLRREYYFLVVCPQIDSPAVQLFSEGYEVTFRCNHWLDEDVWILWFVKTSRMESPIFFYHNWFERHQHHLH